MLPPLFFSLLTQSWSVHAHIAMWNKGLFGFNYPGQATDDFQYYNGNYPVVPLRHFENLTISQWFGRGLKAYPPAPGDYMELPSGGVFEGELACNRAWTTYRHPGAADQPLNYYACPTVGPLHVNNTYGTTPDPQYFGGTALAIAYTSDVDALMPNDMTVISVNHTSVWTRLTDYHIPAKMPKCPEGGCLCTWNWIHQAGHGEGYGMEIYNNLYRCNVTGDISDDNVIKMGSGTVPVLCENEPEQCVIGPKQPMYVYQAEGNNMQWPSAPPSYNLRYGFKDGAQLDLFDDMPAEMTETASDKASLPIAIRNDDSITSNDLSAQHPMEVPQIHYDSPIYPTCYDDSNDAPEKTCSASTALSSGFVMSSIPIAHDGAQAHAVVPEVLADFVAEAEEDPAVV